MDCISRFQDPMSFRNGSLNKPSPNQVEVFGLKPSPQIILFRFRAMVKEREEELGIFRGLGEDAASPLSTDEIVLFYKIVLSELILNSKPTITDLTIIAGEQKAHAKGIADAICVRIIEVPVDQKLPSMYLLDSIVKNIGKEYVKYFSDHLPEVFCEAYAQVHPSMHHAMRHLFGTWSAVFPFPVLRKIEERLQFSPSLNSQSSGLNSFKASDSPRPTHGIHVNPKYLEARRQFRHPSVGAEGARPTGDANLAASGSDEVKKSLSSTSKITGSSSSSPYRIGHAGSVLLSLDEFGVDNSPRSVPVRASPSHSEIDYGLSRVMGRAEEIIDWQTKNWQGKSNRHVKTAISHSYNNGADLEGPRALISAYGMDEREKKLTHKRQTIEQLDANGIDPKTSIKTWQNTEEEEFDWENMTTLNPLAHSFLPPQQSQSHLDANSSSSLSENRISLAAGNLKSSMLALTKSQYPALLPSSHILPSLSALPPQMQMSSQFDVNKVGNFVADQGLNKVIHSEQHLGGTTSTSQLNLPQIPGRVPLNMQSIGRVPLAQSTFLISQEERQNLPLFLTSSAPSHAIVPSLNYGYLARGQGPSIGFTSSNVVPGMQPPMPIFNAHNMPFHMPGTAFLSHPRGPHPGTTHAVPPGQNIGPVAPNPSAGGPLSGLFSSLVAQGLISLKKQDSFGVEFDPDGLKVRNESTIAALYSDLPRQCTSCGHRFKNQEEHSKHMDWHVSKNRTLKTRKTKPSPKWFVSVRMWLHGVEATGTDAVPGFIPAENAVEKEEIEEMAVPADEDQSACALCGERFDDFYSDEMEEWMYKGAVYMYAPAGSMVGMSRSQLGPIVHAKCRSDSHGLPSEDFVKLEGESAEEGNPRKKLRS